MTTGLEDICMGITLLSLASNCSKTTVYGCNFDKCILVMSGTLIFMGTLKLVSGQDTFPKLLKWWDPKKYGKLPETTVEQKIDGLETTAAMSKEKERVAVLKTDATTLDERVSSLKTKVQTRERTADLMREIDRQRRLVAMSTRSLSPPGADFGLRVRIPGADASL